MKKVVTVSIGRKSFVLDNDAFDRLDLYLKKFKEKIEKGLSITDVMEELEERIAELFSDSLQGRYQVVNLTTVDSVIEQLGMPDGTPMEGSSQGGDFSRDSTAIPTVRKLHRDPDNKRIAGVAGGLALYLNIDVVIVRLLFLAALLMGGGGFWLYIIIWIAAPLAQTSIQKCQARGLPITAENLARFSDYV